MAKKQMQQDKVLLTAEGLAALQEELQTLKIDRRREVASRLEEAIALGDLSENAEYAEAKEEQGQIEARIIELEEKLRRVEIIETDKGGKKATKVSIGSTVSVIGTREDDEEMTYTIVGSMEVDSLQGRISNESPLGRALIGLKVGDKATYQGPGGTYVYEVLSIS